MIDNDSLKTLQLLDEISKDNQVTQRDLSTRLGVALGLTNLYLKRLINKGFVKIGYLQRNKKRIAYILTPQGMAEKSRLTLSYMKSSFRFYKEFREKLKESFSALLMQGTREIVLYNMGELSEIAYLTLIETGLTPVFIVGSEPGKEFLSHRVADFDALLTRSYEKIIVPYVEIDDVFNDFIEKHHLQGKVLTLK